MRRLALGWVTFFTPAAKLGSAPSSLVAGNSTDGLSLPLVRESS
jgi:hypothetical protein